MTTPFQPFSLTPIVQAIQHSPLRPVAKHLLLQVLNHSVEQTAQAWEEGKAPRDVSCVFELADVAYFLKTERHFLQQTVQQAEDIGLLCLEPIPYFKAIFLLHWIPGQAPPSRRLHPGTLHPSTDQNPQPKDNYASPTEAELPRHWKGRPPRRVWRQLRQAVLARDGGYCQYCGQRKGKLACDHVLPVSRGGSSTLDNLVAACQSCNSSKATRTPEEWQAKRAWKK